MDGLINRLHESGASGEKCGLEGDVQKGIAGAKALVKRGREVEGGFSSSSYFGGSAGRGSSGYLK